MQRLSTTRRRAFLWAVSLVCTAMLAGASAAAAKDQVRVAGLTWPGYGWWYIMHGEESGARSRHLLPGDRGSVPELQPDGVRPARGDLEHGRVRADRRLAEHAGAPSDLRQSVARHRQILLRPEIKSAADLKGKKVAVMVGGLPQIMLGIYLEKNGIPFEFGRICERHHGSGRGRHDRRHGRRGRALGAVREPADEGGSGRDQGGEHGRSGMGRRRRSSPTRIS